MAAKTKANFGLGSLFPGHTAESFLANYWPHKLVAMHGPLSRLGDIPVDKILDFEGLLNHPQIDVAAWFNEGAYGIAREHALTYWRHGVTLSVTNLQVVLPELRDFLWNVARELGVPPQYCRCGLFTGKKGGTVHPHYGWHWKFIVQMKGVKIWWAAENEHVVWPTEHYNPSEDDRGEAALYLPKEMPKGQPKSERIVMKPGTVLFNPPGWWHTTKNEADSLIFTFTIEPPHWAAVASNAIRRLLIQDPEWRATCIGFGGNERQRAEAQKQLVERMADLKKQVANLPPELLVAESFGTPHTTGTDEPINDSAVTGSFRRTNRKFEVVRGKGDTALVQVAGHEEIPVQESFATFFEQLARHEGTAKNGKNGVHKNGKNGHANGNGAFRGVDLMREAPAPLLSRDVTNAIEAALELGLIERAK